MPSPRLQVGIWLLLYTIWVVVSHSSHPTLLLDLVVTAILLAAYAAAVYFNWLVLVPRLLQGGAKPGYVAGLVASLAGLTLLAVCTLRWTYVVLGYGGVLGAFWPNYLVDLAGMALHLAGAALVLMLAQRKRGLASNKSAP
jgi:hypothetical protein